MMLFESKKKRLGLVTVWNYRFHFGFIVAAYFTIASRLIAGTP